MRIKAAFACFLVIFVTLVLPTTAAPGARGKTEVYSALAQIPVPATTVNVKIYISGYSTTQDADQLNATLLKGGPNALLKALRKMKSLGRIERDGSVGFYDFKLIISKQTPQGRHIYAVADRPIGFLESYYSTRSRDYPFGIMELELKGDDDSESEKGVGTLIYAAKVRVIKGEKIEVENFSFAPIKLLGIRQL